MEDELLILAAELALILNIALTELHFPWLL